MSIIKDFQLDENGWFGDGKFTSTSLFQGDMAVSVFVDDGATVEYAEKCIKHYNNLNQNDEFLLQLNIYLEKFFLYMYDAWKEMGIYDDIVEELEPIMEGYKTGKKLVEYLSNPTLYVYAPQEEGIGYGIEYECPWEPEHQCLIIIRDDVLLYVGQSGGLDAWCDEDEYYCIWNDEDES